jgi:hypothetical protein
MMTLKTNHDGGNRHIMLAPIARATALLWLGLVTLRGADYALTFDGAQAVETQITGDKLAGNELTVEYWFKGSKMLSAVRIQDGGNAWVVAGWGGGTGTAGAVPMMMIKTSASQDARVNATVAVQNGSWHHLAVTYKRNTTNGIVTYVDGVAVQRANAADQPIPAINGKVYLGALSGNQEFLIGALDEVCIWRRALTESEIRERAIHPRRLLGIEPSLVAYFPFNDSATNSTRDLASGADAVLKNRSANARVPQTNIVLATSAPVPAAAGLWLGEISLNAVSQAYSGSTNSYMPAPTGTPFDFNIILHADTNGQVRLLKDVTIMQKRNTASNLTEVVLLTDDTLIPQYDGVLKRSGKLVGARYSSPFYQFEGQSLPLVGGLALNSGLTGTNRIPTALATHPFRHPFHPNHKNPVDLQGTPYDLERQIEIAFSESKTGLNEGRDILRGTYRETLTGLHKVPLVTTGTISLQRISLVGKLNNQ